MRLILIFFLSLPGAAFAKASNKDKLVKKLFYVLKMEDGYNKEIDSGIDLVLQGNMSLITYRSDLIRFANEELSWKTIEPNVRARYKEYFTRKELSDLIRFFSTSTGLKYSRTGPRLTMEVAQMAQDKAREKLPEFFKGLKKRRPASDDRPILEKMRDSK